MFKRKRLASARQAFLVAQQTVLLEVDLGARTLSGVTELTIVPSSPSLRVITLDARYMEVHSVYVNDRPARYAYNDPIKPQDQSVLNLADPPESTYPGQETVSHAWLAKDRVRGLYCSPVEHTLEVYVPEKTKITLTDTALLIGALLPAVRDSPGLYRTPNLSDQMYTPLSVKIHYTCKNPKDGVRFVGGRHRVAQSPPTTWIAHTAHSLVGLSALSWVPCVDLLWERSTWKLEITTQRTVDPTDETLPELVVAVGDLLNAKEEMRSPGKKTTTVMLVSPVLAHHVGWAVGPFVELPMQAIEASDEEAEQEEDDSETPVRGTIYCLPEDQTAAQNTCIVLSKAVDFFSREFGSYPFSSYSVVFAKDAPHSSYAHAGLTIHSTTLLHELRVIDPLLDTTEVVVRSLAKQWLGVNLLPKSDEDLWITIGILGYMTDMFLRRLMKGNESRYRIKKRSDHLCEVDIARPPLAAPALLHPVNEAVDLAFVELKAPLVLYILDRRMVKTDKLLGLQRVVQKLFLEAMLDELPGIDCAHFQHVAEKVGHAKLDTFFRQWVYGLGTPVFRVTQRFNKKRMFIEMGIRQVQADEVVRPAPQVDSFMEEAELYFKEEDGEIDLEGELNQTPFTGPMTIRIHEADGTPYEHIVHIKEGFTKLDIQYNTKYKRMKRRYRNAHAASVANDDDDDDDEDPEPALPAKHCFGNVLESPEEKEEWGLVEWSAEEEERMFAEAFEWLRVDADFEWLCKIYVNQPDYMYAAQLQQDRDVEAQIEAVRYLARVPHPQPVHSSFLTRTLMDLRYFYGVRIEAAKALAQHPDGLRILLKAAQKLFCFDNLTIPLPNDFSDFPQYFIQRAFPSILASLREGKAVPIQVQELLLDMLRYNDNSSNAFDDSFYVEALIEGLVSLAVDAGPRASKDFLSRLLRELDRTMRMDAWLPLHRALVSATVIRLKVRLALHGLMELSYTDLLPHTRPGPDELRIAAIDGVFALGGLKNRTFLRYFFRLVELDALDYFRFRAIESLRKAVAMVGVGRVMSILDDEEFEPEVPKLTDLNTFRSDEDGELFFEDSMDRETALSRATVGGVIGRLRDQVGEVGKGIRQELWKAVRLPVLGVELKKRIYDVCDVLFEPEMLLTVTLPIPRDKTVVAKATGTKVVLYRQSKLKIQFSKKLALKILLSGRTDTRLLSKLPRTPVSRTLSTRLVDEISGGDGTTIVLQTPVEKPRFLTLVSNSTLGGLKSVVTVRSLDGSAIGPLARCVNNHEVAIKMSPHIVKSLRKSKATEDDIRFRESIAAHRSPDTGSRPFDLDLSEIVEEGGTPRTVKINFKKRTMRLLSKTQERVEIDVDAEDLDQETKPAVKRPKLMLKLKPRLG